LLKGSSFVEGTMTWQAAAQIPYGDGLAAPGLLVVDGDPGTRRLLREFLDRAGFVTEEAPDAAAALARLTTREPAAIVLHDGLSGQQGLEIVTLLRAEHPALPVVFIASIAGPEGRARAARLCGAGWLDKPFGVPQLVSTVRRAVGQRPRLAHRRRSHHRAAPGPD
jgi:DNA-binding response OmpR family regulator